MEQRAVRERGAVTRWCRRVFGPLVALVVMASLSVSAGGVSAQEQPDPTTATSAVDVVGPVGDSTESSGGLDEVQLVTIALLALAVVVAIASIAFYRRTNPARVAAAEGARSEPRN